MKTNTRPNPIYTKEGLKISHITPVQSLLRTVLSCFLWEDGFYEDGTSVAERIKSLIPKVSPESVAAIAIYARTTGNLRHVPLFIAREMARLDSHKHLVGNLLPKVIQRADELAEFLSIYWKDGKCPLSAQVKKGLAAAFNNFNRFQLSKWNKDNKVKLRDVLALCHAKPKDEEQSALWKDLLAGNLSMPDSWETAISACKTSDEKRREWTRLIRERKLGGLALLRNLRNLVTYGVPQQDITNALREIKSDRILPFRFITAAKYAPQIESVVEEVMLKCLSNQQKLSGKTCLVIDSSPSMAMANISNNSEMTRFDAAAALAILLREICENVSIYAFNRRSYVIPDRHGFALRDAIFSTKDQFSAGGLAVEAANKEGYDRIIVISDGQWHSTKDGKPLTNVSLTPGDKLSSPLPNKGAYMINIDSSQNGVGYGDWTVINGFSESVVAFISELERNKLTK